ncbi:hypothetical protein SAMN02982919_01962 [Giesbergeria anulus]|uniref:Uncharacterized protein n=1 Tax=Giesbergeria anulus TaxID=180197 RepID=A0A1H9MCI9_9BURK|nr:hypothetical protein SAMN02982919_01962 [Giesbergeria anulus]
MPEMFSIGRASSLARYRGGNKHAGLKATPPCPTCSNNPRSY